MHFTAIMLAHDVTASELCESIRRTGLNGRMVGNARLWTDEEVARLLDDVAKMRFEIHRYHFGETK